jgi:uncharacterized membrane protein
MTAAAVRARNLVALLELLLVTDFTLWHALRFSTATAAMLIVLGVLPWAVLAPGLWRGNRRRHVWATLLAAPYLGYGIMDVLANPGARRYAGGLVLITCALFIALVAFLRVSRPPAPAPT